MSHFSADNYFSQDMTTLINLLLICLLATVATSGPAVEFKKPNGMSNEQYAKLMEEVNSRPHMSDQEKRDWWDGVVEWFKKVFERIGSECPLHNEWRNRSD